MGEEAKPKLEETKNEFRNLALPALGLTLVGIVGQALAQEYGYELPFSPFEGAMASFLTSSLLVSIGKIMTVKMSAALAMVPPLFGGVFEFTRTGSADNALTGAGYGLLVSLAGTVAYQLMTRGKSSKSKDSM